MLPAEMKDLPEVIHVGGEVLVEDQDIFHIDKTEWKLTQKRSSCVEKCFQHF